MLRSCMVVVRYVSLCVLVLGLSAEEKLFEYKLKDGRTIVGQVEERDEDGPLHIKLWFKTRFMGKMKVNEEDVVSVEKYVLKCAALLGTGKTDLAA